MEFIIKYLSDLNKIIDQLNIESIRLLVEELAALRQRRGRLFLLGVGGSAANCSHAVNDFRKLTGIEAYTPSDNVSELTARTNDEGWITIFVEWLKTSQLSSNDMVFVLSVGGGNKEKEISQNIIIALHHAKYVGARILGIVGRDDGYTYQEADVCVLIPQINIDAITPYTESLHMVILHLLVSHPKLQTHTTKWESVEK